MLVDGRRDEISINQSREFDSIGHSDPQTHQI